ncbi:unnamed protein product [Blepharisma stoltei]|uniref:Uncharacterized protein n=1 Tax=Blepharisma stoltei TaxID=1481888 RepID=A0AAU9J3V3_9CILI|nr:unnamed protein product [Blepharisma stoltei]
MLLSIIFYVLLALIALYCTWRTNLKANSQIPPAPVKSQTIPASHQENKIQPPSQPIKVERKAIQPLQIQNPTKKAQSIPPSENKENINNSVCLPINEAKYNIVLKSQPISKPEEKRRDLEFTSFILKETEKSIEELISKPRKPLGSISEGAMRRSLYDPNVPEFHPKLRLNPDAQDFCPIK